MLEVRKSTFARNYENQFFREFARHLHKAFQESNRYGILIGSPYCEIEERLQIDALLITKNVVCIIDFKNYCGKINLPNEKNFEMGIWTNSTGQQIQGGSSINPFIQLKNQKRRFSEVYNKYIQNQLNPGDIFNPNHTVRIVCFQEEIEIYGKIPSIESLNFFILNKLNFLEGILDIIDVSDKDVSISPKSIDAFKKVFKAENFRFEDKPLEDKLKNIAQKSLQLDYKKLYSDQHDALIEIKKFIENPQQQIFILQGTVNSGKSYLIPFIKEIAFNLGINETQVFASSSRVANNLLTIGGLERVNSIYSYIYGGQKNNINNEGRINQKNEVEIGEGIELEAFLFEEVPLKDCDNDDNALFIVDESHLVSDSYNKSIDLIFGTGYLLKDFLSFTNIAKSNRKIVFIGDPYQLQFGNTDESSLNPIYLESTYNVKTNTFQLKDKPDFSFINKELLFCVDKIRNEYFHSLKFEINDNFRILSNDYEKEKTISDLIKLNKGHILYYKNEDALERNMMIKKDILKNGEKLAVGDMVIFNNNIEIKNENPDSYPKKIFNGEFAYVTKAPVLVINKSVFDRKGKLISNLQFAEIGIQLIESGLETKILSFENYRNSPKGKMSKFEEKAFRILLYQIADKELNNFLNGIHFVDDDFKELLEELKKGKKVKSKIIRKIQLILSTMPTSDYYKIKNSAWIKYGWAMTVHKSMSFKWEEVIFNVERVDKNHEDYFRWLYTGISRAKNKVSLINYKPITPFDKTEIIDCNTSKSTNKYFFTADCQQIDMQLDEFKEFVLSKLKGIEVSKIEHLNWQERFHLKGKSKMTIISFTYNSQGRFRFPTHSGGDSSFGNEVIKMLKTVKFTFDLSVIKDNWRKYEYENFANDLKQDNVFIWQIIQTNFKDRIKLINLDDEEIDLEVDYNSDGAFSKITVRYYSNYLIWEIVNRSLNRLKGEKQWN